MKTQRVLAEERHRNFSAFVFRNLHERIIISHNVPADIVYVDRQINVFMHFFVVQAYMRLHLFPYVFGERHIRADEHILPVQYGSENVKVCVRKKGRFQLEVIKHERSGKRVDRICGKVLPYPFDPSGEQAGVRVAACHDISRRLVKSAVARLYHALFLLLHDPDRELFGDRDRIVRGIIVDQDNLRGLLGLGYRAYEAVLDEFFSLYVGIIRDIFIVMV
jgi:hypothetical protein